MLTIPDFWYWMKSDRMLDMAFRSACQIAKFLPKTRQTLMFSATMREYHENLG